MIEVAEWFRSTQLSGATRSQSFRRQHDTVKIKNITGAEDREKGDILGIDTKLLTEISVEYPWFNSVEPHRNKGFGILPKPLADQDVGDLQIAGIVGATVDVLNVSHRRAKIVDDEFNLESSIYGPVEIIWSPDSTGVATCLVNIDGRSPSFWMKTPTGGIPGRQAAQMGSSICTLQEADETGQLSNSLDSNGLDFLETVFHGGTNPVTNEYIQAKAIDGLLTAYFEDCP